MIGEAVLDRRGGQPCSIVVYGARPPWCGEERSRLVLGLRQDVEVEGFSAPNCSPYYLRAISHGQRQSQTDRPHVLLPITLHLV